MDRKEYRKIQMQKCFENKNNNIYIHGFLQAVQNYVCAFGFESTAAYILRTSGICKEDLIRCQIENGHATERMLAIIEKAFLEPLF